MTASAELASLLSTPSPPSRALLDLPNGLHADVPADVYHARIPGVASKSALDLIARSPARYRAWLDGADRPETAALHLGKAIHMALLEPELFTRTYVVAPDFGDLRYKGPKAAREVWRKEHPGAVILDSKEGATTLAMVRAVVAHPTARALLLDGMPECTLKWSDPETGLLCKARPDYYLEDIATCVDIKSTMDAREDAFSRSIYSLGYHRQEAHYVSGFRAVGRPCEDFLFLAIEKEPPHDLSIWQLDDEARELGQEQIRRAMRLLAKHTEEDDWPGYPSGIHRISLPPWARKRT
jgi:hypothetical protein